MEAHLPWRALRIQTNNGSFRTGGALIDRIEAFSQIPRCRRLGGMNGNDLKDYNRYQDDAMGVQWTTSHYTYQDPWDTH